MFLLYGPNTNGGTGSVIYTVEAALEPRHRGAARARAQARAHDRAAPGGRRGVRPRAARRARRHRLAHGLHELVRRRARQRPQPVAVDVEHLPAPHGAARAGHLRSQLTPSRPSLSAPMTDAAAPERTDPLAPRIFQQRSARRRAAARADRRAHAAGRSRGELLVPAPPRRLRVDRRARRRTARRRHGLRRGLRLATSWRARAARGRRRRRQPRGARARRRALHAPGCASSAR